MISGFLATMLCVVSVTWADPPKSRIPSQGDVRSDFVADTSWVPRRADEAFAFSRTEAGLYAASRLIDVQDYAKSILAEDRHGLDEMVESGRLVILKCYTKVLVLERYVRPFVASDSNVLEVRILDGTQAKKSAFMLEEHVERLILRPIVADLSYRPKVGDVVSSIYDETPFSETWAALDEFEAFRKAGDRVSLEKMIEAGRILPMPRFIEGQVLKIYAIEQRATRKGPRDVGERLDEASDYTAKHPAGFAVELKTPNGSTFFVSRRNVGRPINGPVAPKLESSILSLDRVKKVSVKPPAPSDRSRADLTAAEFLEKQGKSDQAIVAYSDIMKSYPGTDAAEEASVRFGVLTGRPAKPKKKSSPTAQKK